MAKVWERLRLFVVGFWTTRNVVTPHVERVAGNAARTDTRSKDIEETGRWYFKRDVLDRLDEYFDAMKRVRAVDPDTYDLYSQIGAVIVSPRTILETSSHLDTDGGTVGLGAIMLGRDVEMATKNIISAKFLYFKKMDRPGPHVQRTDLTTFCVTGFYTTRKNRKGRTFSKGRSVSFVGSFHVGVAEDGHIQLLRERYSYRQSLGSDGSLVQHKWGFPPFLTDIQLHSDKKRSTEEIAQSMFAATYNTYKAASSDVRITVAKGGLTGALSVDLLRMPYFFADREALPGEPKKKIFHIVRTHSRTMSGGKQHYVKSHFRGLRQFAWNGFAITITMPGKHHADLLTFHGGALDFDEMDPDARRHLTMQEVGQRMRDTIVGSDPR